MTDRVWPRLYSLMEHSSRPCPCGWTWRRAGRMTRVAAGAEVEGGEEEVMMTEDKEVMMIGEAEGVTMIMEVCIEDLYQRLKIIL